MDELNEQAKQVIESLNSPIVQALNNEGITPSYLAKLLHKELSAKQIRCFQHQGEIITTEIPALDIQQKARQDAHKLMDHYPAERHRIEGQIIETRSTEELEALRTIAKGVAEALRHNDKLTDTKG